MSQTNSTTISLSDYTFSFSGLNINPSKIKIIFPSDYQLDRYQVSPSFSNTYIEDGNILYLVEDLTINGNFTIEVSIINGIYEKNYDIYVEFYDNSNILIEKLTDQIALTSLKLNIFEMDYDNCMTSQRAQIYLFLDFQKLQDFQSQAMLAAEFDLKIQLPLYNYNDFGTTEIYPLDDGIVSCGITPAAANIQCYFTENYLYITNWKINGVYAFEVSIQNFLCPYSMQRYGDIVMEFYSTESSNKATMDIDAIYIGQLEVSAPSFISVTASNTYPSQQTDLTFNLTQRGYLTNNALIQLTFPNKFDLSLASGLSVYSLIDGNLVSLNFFRFGQMLRVQFNGNGFLYQKTFQIIVKNVVNYATIETTDSFKFQLLDTSSFYLAESVASGLTYDITAYKFDYASLTPTQQQVNQISSYNVQFVLSQDQQVSSSIQIKFNENVNIIDQSTSSCSNLGGSLSSSSQCQVSNNILTITSCFDSAKSAGDTITFTIKNTDVQIQNPIFSGEFQSYSIQIYDSGILVEESGDLSVEYVSGAISINSFTSDNSTTTGEYTVYSIDINLETGTPSDGYLLLKFPEIIQFDLIDNNAFACAFFHAYSNTFECSIYSQNDQIIKIIDSSSIGLSPGSTVSVSIYGMKVPRITGKIENLQIQSCLNEGSDIRLIDESALSPQINILYSRELSAVKINPISKVVLEDTNYEFSMTSLNNLKKDDYLLIDIPAEIEFLGTVTCTSMTGFGSSSLTCVRNSANQIKITIPKAVAENTLLKIKVSHILNPSCVTDISQFNYYFYDSEDNEIQFYRDLSAISGYQARPLTKFAVSPKSLNIGTISALSYYFQSDVTIQDNSSVKVSLPSSLQILGTGYDLFQGFNNDVSVFKVTAEQAFQIDSIDQFTPYKNFNISFNGIQNPAAKQTVSENIHISVINSDGKLYLQDTFSYTQYYSCSTNMIDNGLCIESCPDISPLYDDEVGCYACKTPEVCLYCDPENVTKCISCQSGYVLDGESGTCQEFNFSSSEVKEMIKEYVDQNNEHSESIVYNNNSEENAEGFWISVPVLGIYTLMVLSFCFWNKLVLKKQYYSASVLSYLSHVDMITIIYLFIIYLQHQSGLYIILGCISIVFNIAIQLISSFMLKSYLKFDENFISIQRSYKLVRVNAYIIYLFSYRNFSKFVSGNSNHDAVYKLQFQNPQFLFKLYVRSLRFSIINCILSTIVPFAFAKGFQKEIGTYETRYIAEFLIYQGVLFIVMIYQIKQLKVKNLQKEQEMITPMDYTPEKFNDSLTEKGNNQIKENICSSSLLNDHQSSSAGNTPYQFRGNSNMVSEQAFNINIKVENNQNIVDNENFIQKRGRRKQSEQMKPKKMGNLDNQNPEHRLPKPHSSQKDQNSDSIKKSKNAQMNRKLSTFQTGKKNIKKINKQNSKFSLND
ncbi:Insulin-like growth factor binding protein, N-terminal [Pseudocohnilembus persalinus]|uniref:Insulin-like growth factor binding protein, N-terminal n=1 Tax=Pseudocohnilembus persalinus TaxID=266149 RepID=A0A0V0QCT2_PSEPJ|nr:Insulin-like growth factor binding protein, N-terminal [Pseudocohnilembus persalinus]|eukprot:KRW99935.1 Insulin-like growth factor binding protein, N-terminal [Pseudocohnilembus persalinus]